MENGYEIQINRASAYADNMEYLNKKTEIIITKISVPVAMKSF
jgi:hypothetical protein